MILQNEIKKDNGEEHTEPPIAFQLSNLVQRLEEYSPTIPDAVTSRLLTNNGFDSTDPRIIRIVSLASQKFIMDIALDALQQCKMRTLTTAPSKSAANANKPVKDKRYTLTFEDLQPVLSEYGIQIRKPPYFV